MTESRIVPILMPKWGLSMKEGRVTDWLVDDGAAIDVGDEILEVETDKIASAVEATDAGVLRRRVGEVGKVYPVKALIGVLADAETSDAEIDAFVDAFEAPVDADEDQGEEEARYRFVELSFGRVRYATCGSGPETVVLVHGFGGELDNWLFNIDALGEAATVYALDLPGHGQSVKTIADPTVPGLADALIAFMDALEIGSAHMVGHSLGGAVAIETASKAAERVSSLALIASAGLGSEINGAYLAGFVGAASRKQMKSALVELFADSKLVSRQMVDDLLKYKRIDGVSEVLQTLSEQVFPGGAQQTILAEQAGAAAVPLLVIWGREDRIIPAAHAENLTDVAKVEIVDAAGHMVQMEAAGQVNTLLTAHIASAS